MMQSKSRKLNTKKYPLTYCSQKDTLCFGLVDSAMNPRTCIHNPCLLDRPAYIEKQKQIEKNIQKNAEEERQRKLDEVRAPAAPIRRQTKTRERYLEEQIRSKEIRARQLYRENKPRAADGIMHEVMILSGKLKKMRGV